MRFLHVNTLNGLLVQHEKGLVLIGVQQDESGTVYISFKEPFTDIEMLTDDEARDLLVQLMTDDTQ